MRKLLLSLACLFLVAGVMYATDVTLVKYDTDKKELTVKEAGKEHIYKLTDQTKVFFVDKNGKAKDGTLEAAIKILANPRAAEKMLKLDITTEKEAVKELKLQGSKKNP